MNRRGQGNDGPYWEGRGPARWMMHILLFSILVSGCSGRSTSVTPAAADAPPGAATTEFDGRRAFEHVRRLVEMGPRPVGSRAHRRARDYIIKHLRRLKITVERDDFTAQTPLGPRSMTNIIGQLPGRSEGVILIASHYDTKLFDDFPFVGANDGGSSTGVLLEIARVLAHRPVEDRPTVWFVFFDGEEALVRWSTNDSKYGSRHLAKKWHAAGVLGRVRALILLDMIGDKELDIKRDALSTRSLVEIIWRTAARMGYEDYFLSERTFVDDDHEPFLRLGVPAVDIIDFHYGPSNRYWHTAEDTLDKIDPESLKIVGDVVIAALPAIEAATAVRLRSSAPSEVPATRGREGL